MKNDEKETPEVFCYLCGIVDDAIKQERHIEFNNSAAQNKVLGICVALKSRIKHVLVVSSGRGGGVRNGRRFPAVARRVSSVTVLYAAFWHNRSLSHAMTACSLLLLMFRLKRLSKGKRICLVAYNRNWIYLPALCVARGLKIDCYLDLEDAPVIGNISILKKLLIRLQVNMVDYLCRDGALLASTLLTNEVKHEQQLICYGVASIKHLPVSLGYKQPVRILFGGSLLKETGVQLLIDSVQYLENKHKDLEGKLIIVMTGYGAMLHDLRKLSRGAGAPWIEFYGEVSLSEYQSVLENVHLGLCLKLPSSEMCATTFPSKVVEYASFGKAVLTTRIEGVVNLFGEEGAFYVKDESAKSLAAAFREVALHPERVIEIAKCGQERLLEKSGERAVADGLMRLLTGEEASHENH